MAENVNDLTIEYREGDQLLVKELDKEVLTKGAWATVMYKYQELDRKTQDFGPVKFAIRRYQKRNGEYQQKSKFTISSVDQANKVIDILQKWL
ncbi:MAG: hypothetical protein JXR42_00160 [Gammaproteobacteria bacterium]|nr:hypothetical protein [Gammaproteobacteria bacterium]